MTTFGNLGIGLKSRPRNGLICLSELAGLLAGGNNSPQNDICLKALCDAFPAGDERLVWGGDPQSNANITNIDAIKYWNIALPGQEVPGRLIEPAEIEDLVLLVEALRDENNRLRGLAEEIAKQVAEEVEDKPLTNCGKVTFGAVCYLLAKYGVINGQENAFQTQGVTDLAPVPNKISSEIAALASEFTNANNPEAGFKDAGRRAAIGEAMAAFNQQIVKNKKS